MMLVRVEVRPSRIHGLGLFVVDGVPAGTAIWQFRPGFDQAFSPAEFDALPAVAQAHLRWFAWYDSEKEAWILSGDHACFMNHDSQPNTGLAAGADGSEPTVALRSLAAGEELTCDYFAFDAEARSKLSPTVG